MANNQTVIGEEKATVGSQPRPLSLKKYRVQVQAHGRSHLVDVEATDEFEAGRAALRRATAAISAKVVRQIDKLEWV